jgi:hypothetical protein
MPTNGPDIVFPSLFFFLVAALPVEYILQRFAFEVTAQILAEQFDAASVLYVRPH